jgi:hypothetical protein
MNEAYSLFKQQYPNVKAEFSKLCEINSIGTTAWSYGTYSACICSIYQSMKLMLIGSKLKELTTGCY